MKRLSAAVTILILSGGLALAQGVGTATAPLGSATTGPTNPGGTTPPGITRHHRPGQRSDRRPARTPAMRRTSPIAATRKTYRAGRRQSAELKR